MCVEDFLSCECSFFLFVFCGLLLFLYGVLGAVGGWFCALLMLPCVTFAYVVGCEDCVEEEGD